VTNVIGNPLFGFIAEHSWAPRLMLFQWESQLFFDTRCLDIKKLNDFVECDLMKPVPPATEVVLSTHSVRNVALRHESCHVLELFIW
jgi:hypothetical protein